MVIKRKICFFHLFQFAMATSPRSIDTISVCSTASSCPDRHGFYGGFQRTDKPKEPLSKAQIMAREKKWLYMMDNWSIYMSRNYKKVNIKKYNKYKN